MIGGNFRGEGGPLLIGATEGLGKGYGAIHSLGLRFLRWRGFFGGLRIEGGIPI